MTEKDYQTLENMEHYGGGFVKALAGAARHADPYNLKKLKKTFSNYFRDYTFVEDTDKPIILSKGYESTWYMIKQWRTKAGFMARIHKCVWSYRIKSQGGSIFDHYCGYVMKDNLDDSDYSNDPNIDVHGGVTLEGTIEGVDGKWVGFDMAHLGDENIKEPVQFAEEECEKLAFQMKK